MHMLNLFSGAFWTYYIELVSPTTGNFCSAAFGFLVDFLFHFSGGICPAVAGANCEWKARHYLRCFRCSQTEFDIRGAGHLAGSFHRHYRGHR